MVRGSKTVIAGRKSYASIAEGLSHIRGTLRANPLPGAPEPAGLPLGAITVCETVFQRRDTFANRYGREEHVRDLKRAIQDAPDEMEPVDIWWGGDGWYLIDGHHRILAYEALSFTGDIPVRIVKGTLEEALAHVGKANTRNKLMMTKDERMTLAVFYVCLFPEKSLRALAAISGVGKSQVAIIKECVDKVTSTGRTREELMGLSWYELRGLARGESHEDYDHDGELVRMVNEIKKALGPILGQNPQRHVEAVAVALEQISPALYRGLMDSGALEEEPSEEPEEAEY